MGQPAPATESLPSLSRRSSRYVSPSDDLDDADVLLMYSVGVLSAVQMVRWSDPFDRQACSSLLVRLCALSRAGKQRTSG